MHLWVKLSRLQALTLLYYCVGQQIPTELTSECLVQKHGWESRTESGFLIRAPCWQVAGITAGAHGSQRHSAFLHAGHRKLVHARANALTSMIWKDSVQTNLPYALFGVKGKGHEADDRIVHCGNKYLMRRDGLAEALQELGLLSV